MIFPSRPPSRLPFSRFSRLRLDFYGAGPGLQCRSSSRFPPRVLTDRGPDKPEDTRGRLRGGWVAVRSPRPAGLASQSRRSAKEGCPVSSPPAHARTPRQPLRFQNARFARCLLCASACLRAVCVFVLTATHVTKQARCARCWRCWRCSHATMLSCVIVGTSRPGINGTGMAAAGQVVLSHR